MEDGKVRQKRNEGHSSSWVLGLISPTLTCFVTCHVCVCERSQLMVKIHLSICSSALSSIQHQQMFPFSTLTSPCFLLFVSFSQMHFNIWLMVLGWFVNTWPLLVQKACTASFQIVHDSYLLDHRVNKMVPKRTNVFTKVALVGEALYKWWHCFYICEYCALWRTQGLNPSTRDSPMFSLHCIFIAPSILTKVVTQSLLCHILPLQSVSLPVTLILPWRLLAG